MKIGISLGDNGSLIDISQRFTFWQLLHIFDVTNPRDRGDIKTIFRLQSNGNVWIGLGTLGQAVTKARN